jgi:hypothetical protein
VMQLCERLDQVELVDQRHNAHRSKRTASLLNAEGRRETPEP